MEICFNTKTKCFENDSAFRISFFPKILNDFLTEFFALKTFSGLTFLTQHTACTTDADISTVTSMISQSNIVAAVSKCFFPFGSVNQPILGQIEAF